MATGLCRGSEQCGGDRGKTDQWELIWSNWLAVNGSFLSASSQKKHAKKYQTYISTHFRTLKVLQLQRTGTEKIKIQTA